MAAFVEDYASGPEVRAQKPVETTMACPECTPCETCAGQRSITRTAVPLSAEENTLLKKIREQSLYKIDWYEALQRIPWNKNAVDLCVLVGGTAVMASGAFAMVSPSIQWGFGVFVATIIAIVFGILWSIGKRDKIAEFIRQEAQEAARKRYESLLQQIDPSLTPDKVTFDWDDKDPSKVVLYHQDEGVE